MMYSLKLGKEKHKRTISTRFFFKLNSQNMSDYTIKAQQKALLFV